MEAKAPDISILIVSFNTREYLSQCLASIPRAAESLTVETIVVDNGSTDGTQTMLIEQFSHVQLMQSQANLGFGKANNVGARIAKARALLLLNSDCELQTGALTRMLGALDRDPSLGGVLCRLLNPDGSLQPSVHSAFPGLWGLLGDLFFLPSLRFAIYRNSALHPLLLRRTIRIHSRAHSVAWGGGACFLIRRDVFDQVGGFDERFFMYCEDMDLCKRIGEEGYGLLFLPDATAIHHWGKSTAKQPALMLREAYRSKLYYFRKHQPGWRSTVARRIAMGELFVRRNMLRVLAVLPTSRQRAFQERAAASAACLKDLRMETCVNEHRAS